VLTHSVPKIVSEIHGASASAFEPEVFVSSAGGDTVVGVAFLTLVYTVHTSPKGAVLFDQKHIVITAILKLGKQGSFGIRVYQNIQAWGVSRACLIVHG
jgi:hypothetical protein